MELNRKKCIEELDFKIRYAKFTNSEGVLLSTACAIFCSEFVQFYEQKIEQLTEENERLRTFKEYFDSLYGTGLDVANWHENGALEPFDNFYESALQESEGE